jgi:MFS transporter, DHA3 family, macrolide efflux protein
MPKLDTFFMRLWLGQFIALMGNHMSGFAMGLFIYTRTESVTLYALVTLFLVLPEIVLAPIFGVLIDRWNRRTAILLGNAGSAICSLATFFILFQKDVRVWSVLPLIAVGSLFNGFTFTAFTAATSQLVRPGELARASGLVQFGFASALILSPALAGVLLEGIGLRGIYGINLGALLSALGIVLTAKLGPVTATTPSGQSREILKELFEGYCYIKGTPLLLWTLVILGVVNFNMGIMSVLITPVVMKISGSVAVGLIMTLAGLGMLVGSGLLVVCRFQQNKVRVILISALAQGLVFLVVLIRPDIVLIGAGAFVFMFFGGLIGGLNLAIWQKTVPQGMQGRVFSLRTLVMGGAVLLGYLLSAPLSENYFGSLMRRHPWLMKLLTLLVTGRIDPGIEALVCALGLMTVLFMAGLFLTMKSDIDNS